MCSCGAARARPTSSEINDHEFACNAGAQFDYETRRVYASLKTDLYRGLAPSPIASTHCSWASRLTSTTTTRWRPGSVVQARRYTGDIHEGTEWALLLRLFKGGGWVEAGVTDDGKLQAMAMVNF